MAADLSLADLLTLRGEIDQLINHRNLKAAAKTEIQRLKDERRERLEDLSGLATGVFEAKRSVQEATAHLQVLIEEARRAQSDKEHMEKIVEGLDGVIGGKEEELATQERVCETTFARFKQAFASPGAAQVAARQEQALTPPPTATRAEDAALDQFFDSVVADLGLGQAESVSDQHDDLQPIFADGETGHNNLLVTTGDDAAENHHGALAQQAEATQPDGRVREGEAAALVSNDEAVSGQEGVIAHGNIVIDLTGDTHSNDDDLSSNEDEAVKHVNAAGSGDVHGDHKEGNRVSDGDGFAPDAEVPRPRRSALPPARFREAGWSSWTAGAGWREQLTQTCLKRADEATEIALPTRKRTYAASECDERGKRPKTLRKGRSITFDEVYQDGKAPRKLAIISFPNKPHPSIASRWYVLRCETHDSWWWKGDVLRTARAHLLKKCHLGGQRASFQQAIDAFGLRVLDCTFSKAKLNFEACEKQRILEGENNGLSTRAFEHMGRTQTSAKARSPTLVRKPPALPPALVGTRRSARGGTSIVGEPVIGKIYLIWSDTSKAFYAGCRVPANVTEDGYLRPFCGLYFDLQCELDEADSDENRAEDDMDEFKDRQYLVMWLDDRMELPPRADYVIPDDVDVLDWVAVKDFRPFDFEDKLCKESNGYRTAQVFAQRMKSREEGQVSPSLEESDRRATIPNVLGVGTFDPPPPQPSTTAAQQDATRHTHENEQQEPESWSRVPTLDFAVAASASESLNGPPRGSPQRDFISNLPEGVDSHTTLSVPKETHEARFMEQQMHSRRAEHDGNRTLFTHSPSPMRLAVASVAAMPRVLDLLNPAPTVTEDFGPDFFNDHINLTDWERGVGQHQLGSSSPE